MSSSSASQQLEHTAEISGREHCLHVSETALLRRICVHGPQIPKIVQREILFCRWWYMVHIQLNIQLAGSRSGAGAGACQSDCCLPRCCSGQNLPYLAHGSHMTVITTSQVRPYRVWFLAIKTIEHSTIERLLTDNKPSPWISKYTISCIRYKNNNQNTGIIGILNVGIKLTIYFKIFSYILSQSL